MTKFKPGDVVRRTGYGNIIRYKDMLIGDVDTVVAAETDQLHLENFGTGHAPAYFELVCDDPLPDAPRSVMYPGISSQRYAVARRRDAGITLLLQDARQCTISAETALCMAHDLRRMAMEIKRQEKKDA